VAREQAKLSALVRGVMAAVQSASDIAGQQHFDLFANFFDRGEDGKLVPRVVRIELADGSTMDVPVICLVNPTSFMMKRLQVGMTVRLKPQEVKDAVQHGVAKAGASRQSYAVEMGHNKAKDGVRLVMHFEATDDAPESLNRLMEELQNGYQVVTPKGSAPERPMWLPPDATKGEETGQVTRRIDRGNRDVALDDGEIAEPHDWDGGQHEDP